jgi:glycine/D-amino acid oxidase-like deaminating enzyme
MEQPEAVVIGAGLTGVTAALELARNGVEVTLIEQDACAMNRAALRNEGKIHLGFVFVHDASLATAKLMIAGARSFRRILARLAGPRVDTLCVSRPFVYVVADDSLLAPAEIEGRYRAIEAFYRRETHEAPEGDYLGANPDTLFARVPLSALNAHLRSERFLAAFETAEVAIDTAELAAVMRSAIAAESRLRLLPNFAVEAVRRDGAAFRVSGTSGRQLRHIEARHVINASWENRFKIDRTAGMEHPPGWLHRLKYRVIARVPDAMRNGPSVTMVVGRYGDVVIRPDGSAYFSWYPAGLQGWTAALAPPAAWNAPCRGEVAADASRAIAAALLDGIERWYPGASQSTGRIVDAGAIVAYGASDVDDPESGLHDRTRVGVTSSAGYHSVDPGKLTTAPLFGVRAAEAVLEAMATV